MEKQLPVPTSELSRTGRAVTIMNCAFRNARPAVTISFIRAYIVRTA